MDDVKELIKGMDKESLKKSFLSHLKFTLGKDKYSVTEYDKYQAMAHSVWDRLIERWLLTQQRYYHNDARRVYYLSMEFLVGRALRNTVINLGLETEVEKTLDEMGLALEELEDQEMEPGLGNGGLGRLAACFLDSMATLSLPAYGYGIRYNYGIFRQQINDGFQVEVPDNWLRMPCPWEIRRPERSFPIKFYGRVQQFTARNGKMVFHWTDTRDVVAVPYDMPIPGFKNNTVNTLKLWSALSSDELNLSDFNRGNYMEACEGKVLAENITRVLYPNDNFFEGKILRLKQQYFFSCASLQDIIRRYKSTHQTFKDFSKKVVIQLNDTHPAIAIPELMRIFLDEEEMGWEESFEIVNSVFAYTNHTLLPEALEKWPTKYFDELLPRHSQIIHEINRRFLRDVATRYPGDTGKLERMSILEMGEEPKFRMAFLAVVGSFAVNGVAEIHSHLLKTTVLHEFAEFFPGKFQNKTNGVTQRRWMRSCNPQLSELISGKIGVNWIKNLDELKGIEKWADDPQFQKTWRKIKGQNKKVLAEILEKEFEKKVNLDSIFDVQIKRLHEYKRQLMNAFFIIHRYLEIKKDPENSPYVPRTMIFGAKAAPGYDSAKLIIKLINSIGEVINNDAEIGDKLKVFFLPDYRVSLAEKIIPAADLSEQISTAGMEASGTGNMKLSLNGALTMGTLDGANIEIKELVGDENIFIFGLEAHQVPGFKANYQPLKFLSESPELSRIMSLIENNFFSPEKPGLFEPLLKTLKERDFFLVFPDFKAYCEAQDKVDLLWRNKTRWTRSSILNVARCGKFSSDRTISEYADEIWRVTPITKDPDSQLV